MELSRIRTYLAAAADRAFAVLGRNLTSTDLFALAVLSMIVGHAGYYFISENLWIRAQDRIFMPVFLVSAGYNVGRRTSDTFFFAALLLATGSAFFIHHVLPLNTLFTIMALRAVINPVMDWALKGRLRFWGLNLALLLLAPLTNAWLEYGSLGLILAMAGWINRNRDETPRSVVRPHQYFIFAGGAFLAFTQFNFRFSVPQFLLVLAGLCVVMRLLYDFRPLLSNALRRPPRDGIGKVCALLGHKGLEIYVLHSLLFQALNYYALNIWKG